MESAAAHNTLYLNNINEKVKKNVLKQLLYMLFSQYGKVIQIVACKGIKMRGQAWVVFQDAPAALSALKGKQSFNFYGKPLRIQFAKSNAHVVSRKGGVTTLPASALPPHPPSTSTTSTTTSASAGVKRARDEEEEEVEEPAKEARVEGGDE